MNTYTAREIELRKELEARGFIIDFEKKDGDGGYVVRQWVTVAGRPGCGLLNEILIREYASESYPMLGFVQYGADENISFAMGSITPAKWWEFFFQHDRFGQTPWWQFILIVLGSFLATGAVAVGMSDWKWTLLTLAPIVLITWQTYRNFKRTTV